MFYIKVKRFWKILYTFTCIFYNEEIFVKNKKNLNVWHKLYYCPLYQFWSQFYSAYFYLFYKKIKYCKITNGTYIQTAYII